MIPWNMEIERRLQTLEDYYRGIPPEQQPKASSSESLGQKIDRLIAYFERRNRENAKRAEKLEKKLATEFNPWDQSAHLERSSYFFSGKSEAYANAASKVREILGEPKPEATTCTRQAPHVCKENGPCNGFPKTEEWVVEFRLPKYPSIPWGDSWDKGVCGKYSSEAEAWEAIRKNRVATGDQLDRRPRRVE